MSEAFFVKPSSKMKTWIKRKYGPPVEEKGYICFKAEQSHSTVKMIGYTRGSSSSSITVSLQISYDEKSWTNWTGEIITLAKSGDKVYVKANNYNDYFYAVDSYDFCSIRNYFVMTGKISVSGNIMYLLDPTGISITFNYKNVFNNIFYNCNSLIDASKLIFPATELTEYCYNGMFEHCTSLTAAPELPATQLAEYCYCAMFWNCASLTSAPELPATQLAKGCYEGMFQHCTSLTAAPELPATQLVESCYRRMFSNCTSLTTAPVLLATELADYCYDNIFVDCIQITDAHMPNINENQYNAAQHGVLAYDHTITIHFKES